MTADPKRIDAFEREIDAAAGQRDAAAIAAVARTVLQYQSVVSAARPDPEPQKGERDYERLWELAKRAMAILGGQAEPPLHTLADYDSDRYGPMLGVSDEGSATAAIRRGALAAPKAAVLSEHTPLTLGIAHDAERLGAVGEVAVGPDEFATIRLAARGRVLTTTNVGTRVNARLFLAPPEVRVQRGALDKAIDKLSAAFAPFVKTASGRPRHVTVLIRFDPKFPERERKTALRKLQAVVAAGKFCNPKWHCLGLYVNPGVGKRMASRVRAGIDLAAAAGLRDAAVVGLHDDRFGPYELDEILEHAAQRGVRVVARDRVDPQTTARHVWTGLAVARNMGLELGKYGLVPLTFEDQKEVIARIQYWFPHWAAAPVFYVDYPLVTATGAYHGPSLGDGVRKWLEMVAKLGVRVVLIDTAKKSEGRRLLKDSAADDRGFLTADEVKDLTACAMRLGVKVLWAGGITLPQAYTLGRLGVFGLYVTSAAASLLPLDAKTRRDPGMLGIREPQAPAVARVKLLIEAGFLVGRGAPQLAPGAESLLKALAAKDENAAHRCESNLHAAAVEAWRTHLAGTS
jgi:hypothetical protein